MLEIEVWIFGTFSTDLVVSFDAWGSGNIIIWARIKHLVCDAAALKTTLDVNGVWWEHVLLQVCEHLVQTGACEVCQTEYVRYHKDGPK